MCVFGDDLAYVLYMQLNSLVFLVPLYIFAFFGSEDHYTKCVYVCLCACVCACATLQGGTRLHKVSEACLCVHLLHCTALLGSTIERQQN